MLMFRTLKSGAFFKSFREALFALLFNIGGLFAGFAVASQLGVFELSSWGIAIYPAILSAKGVIGGLFAGRLSTALHLGTVYPRFSGNTKSFYQLYDAMIALTLLTSVVISLVSMVFGAMFWGMAFSDLSSFFTVIVATMALGLALTFLTVNVSFVSFKRGLDPDVIVYPVISTVADIFITLCYVVVLNLFYLSDVGKYLLVLTVTLHFALVVHLLRKHFHEEEFSKTLKESIITIGFVAFIVSITGTVLKNISAILGDRKDVYTIYPAMVSMVGDVGSVIGSTATTKLSLGLLRPAFLSIKKHATQIFSVWIASIMLLAVLATLSLDMNGMFTIRALLNLSSILLVTNFIAVTVIIILSFSIAILTFKKGLDPDNFVIPIESSFADSITSIALLAALIIFV
jgi:mgtE-like transporter